MPVPTPFHPRTAALCTSMSWKEWAGHYAVRSYDTSPEREYFAFRNGAGVIDVTPLYKYELRGPGAAALLSRMTVRDLRTLKVGRVTYLCWCDDDGKVVDDGTVSRLD
ncbi:MAG: aminomethyltransferase family protein, partial [Myxococcales bacterium]|nr:aminomethyltransferase family protein [Myxococcales bacterium]